MKRTLMTLGLAAAMAMPTFAVNFASGDGANESVTVLPGTLVDGVAVAPGPGTIYVIPRNSAWQNNAVLPNNPEWISFVPGSGGNGTPQDEVQPNSTVNPRASFFETFSLSGDTLASFTLSVWADDTAAVYVNNVLVFNNNPNQDGRCAAGPIACEPLEEGLITLANTPGLAGIVNTNGTNTIRFDVYQQGLKQFGLLYTGSSTAEDVVVPEPSTWAMLGGGLVALAYSRRRRS